MLTLAPTLAELPFRGNRNYLHSTDLYPALAEFVRRQFSPTAFIENLTIRRLASKQVRVNLDGPAGAFGSFRIRQGKERIKGWLSETDKPVRTRVQFDEVPAMEAVVSGPGFVRFENLLQPYTAIELLFALTKVIAVRESSEHWWICQMDFISPLRELAPLECRLKDRLSNRYLSAEIYQAGQRIGSAVGMANIAGMQEGIE